MPNDAKNRRTGLSEQDLAILKYLLHAMIPRSADGRMPSAEEVGCIPLVCRAEDIPRLRDGLGKLNAAAVKQEGTDFCNLGPDRQDERQDELFGALRKLDRRFFNWLVQRVIESYYQQDQVLELIGMRAGPPFPDGYRVEDGDLSLLEPVFENHTEMWRVGTPR